MSLCSFATAAERDLTEKWPTDLITPTPVTVVGNHLDDIAKLLGIKPNGRKRAGMSVQSEDSKSAFQRIKA
jgi:hypothetical protein